MSPLSFLLSAISTLFFFQPLTNAFSFTCGTPTQCDPLTINWTGGTAPFQLLLVPVYGTPRNISIPSSSFSDGTGSFSFPLQLAQSSQMLLTMSDATGWNSGGSTAVLTVGASQGGSCNTTDPGVAFYFQLNSALQQCSPFVFSGYTGAVQPVTIYATIPGGNSMMLNPPVGPTSFSWTANVTSGTPMIFFMTDAQGRQGGSSDVMAVGSSGDNTCLNGQSPLSITASAPSSTGTGSPSQTTGSRASPSSSASNISLGAIAGTVIGGLLFVAVVVTLGLFCLRKNRERGSSTTAPWVGPGGNSQYGQQLGIDSQTDLTYNPAQASVVTPFSVPPGGASGPIYPYSPNHSGPPYNSNLFVDSPPLTQASHSPRHSNPSTQYSDHPAHYPAAGAHYRPPSQSLQEYPYDPYQQDAFVEQPPQLYPPLPYQSPTVPHVGPGVPGAAVEPYSMQNTGQSTSIGSMSAAQRKVAMAGTSYNPSRFILHTDAEDVLPPPNVDGVVELPPQYSERHGGPQIQNPKEDPTTAP